AVVETDADELAGIDDGRVQPGGGGGDGHPLADRGDGVVGGRAALEECARRLGYQGRGELGRADDPAAREARGEARLEIRDAVALEHAEARRLTVDGIADELHGRWPPGGNVVGL